MINPYYVPGMPRKAQVSASDIEMANEIIKTVCNYKKVSIPIVRAVGRKRPHVYARMLCMYFIKAKTHLTLKETGNMFSFRDHTTVIHARNTLQDLADVDPAVRADIKNIQILLIYGKGETENSLPVRQAERAGN